MEAYDTHDWNMAALQAAIICLHRANPTSYICEKFRQAIVQGEKRNCDKIINPEE